MLIGKRPVLFHGSFFTLFPFITQPGKILKTLMDQLLSLTEGDREFETLILDGRKTLFYFIEACSMNLRGNINDN